MAAKSPANIKLHLTIKADLKHTSNMGGWPLTLCRFETTFTGGLQEPYGTGVKPASFSLRLKTLYPLRRDIRQTVFPFVHKLIPVMSLTKNTFFSGLRPSMEINK